ncbi:unnamed protein product, partial [Polarella glacialis]
EGEFNYPPTSCGFTDKESLLIRQMSGSSSTSLARYADPAQTLIFLDWDDTLFPTTELFDCWSLPKGILRRRQPEVATAAAEADEETELPSEESMESLGSASTLSSPVQKPAANDSNNKTRHSLTSTTTTGSIATTTGSTSNNNTRHSFASTTATARGSTTSLPQTMDPITSEQTTAEHPNTGKQQPRRKAGVFNNLVVRLMRRIFSRDPTRKVASCGVEECRQIVEEEGDVKALVEVEADVKELEVGVDVKELEGEEEEEKKEEEDEEESEEEDLSEWCFPDSELTAEQEALLKDWQCALFQCLTTACTLSTQVVIVTNSSRPWVETCVDKFAPNCKKFFAKSADLTGSIKVVYARDVFHQMRRKRKNSGSSGLPVKRSMAGCHLELTEELTRAKFHAMLREAKAFYRRYKGQSWKNILSIGDMLYEHHAVTEMGIQRHAGTPGRGSREQLRVKSLLLPENPRISELTLSLRFSRRMLPVYVRFDGDLDLNLQDCVDPLHLISQALSMPEVLGTDFPRHAWGIGKAPECKEELRKALADLDEVVQFFTTPF